MRCRNFSSLHPSPPPIVSIELSSIRLFEQEEEEEEEVERVLINVLGEEGGHERVQETGENGFWRKAEPTDISFCYGCVSRKLWWIFFKANTRVQDSSPFAFASRFIAPDEGGKAGNQRYISKPYRFYVTSFTRILNKYIYPETSFNVRQFWPVLFIRTALLTFRVSLSFRHFHVVKINTIIYDLQEGMKCFRIRIEDFRRFRRSFVHSSGMMESRERESVTGDESRWLSRWKFRSNNRYPAIRIGECNSGWSVPFDHVRDRCSPLSSLRIEMWQYINCPLSSNFQDRFPRDNWLELYDIV